MCNRSDWLSDYLDSSTDSPDTCSLTISDSGSPFALGPAELDELPTKRSNKVAHAFKHDTYFQLSPSDRREDRSWTKDISIFVGSNNSGKTSVAQAMHLFLGGSRERVSIHDISASKWHDIDAFQRGDEGAALPEIGLDLWFEVSEDDLHRVIDLLPSLDWEGTHVGVRITCGPRNPERYARALSREAAPCTRSCPHCRPWRRR